MMIALLIMMMMMMVKNKIGWPHDSFDCLMLSKALKIKFENTETQGTSLLEVCRVYSL